MKEEMKCDNVFNIPTSVNFLETLYKFILEKKEDQNLSDITIFLPNRRSCNKLRRIFLSHSENNAIILPKLKSINDIDMDISIFNDINIEELKYYQSNITELEYRVILIKEFIEYINSNRNEFFKNLTFEQKCDLSNDLEIVLKELNENQVDDFENIIEEIEGETSAKVQISIEILNGFYKEVWKKKIKQKIITNEDVKIKLLEFYSKYYKEHKPNYTIIVAGVLVNMRVTMEFIKTLIRHDNCYYIFNGLDKNLKDEEWNNIDEYHPQFLTKKMIEFLFDKQEQFNRNLIRNLEESECEYLETIMTRSMLPYKNTDKWLLREEKCITKEEIKQFYDRVSIVKCENRYEEIKTISYMVKYFYSSNKDQLIGIITTDNEYAAKLELELKKNNNLKVNNMFGNKLLRTDIVNYLFLLVDLYKSDFNTIQVLSLLKHRFTECNNKEETINLLFDLFEGKEKPYWKIFEEFRSTEQYIKNKDKYDKIEIFLNNIKNLFDNDKFICNSFFNTFNRNYSIMRECIRKNALEEDVLLSTNLDVIETTKTYNNKKKHENNKVMEFLNELLTASELYGNFKEQDEESRLNEYICLLKYFISQNSFSDKYSIHPNISIISPDDAILLNYDTLIISGLNEGMLPKHIPNDAWLNKTIRAKLKIASKEEIIGNNAYNFIQCLGNGKRVILTNSKRNNDDSLIDSKFLIRLETFLECQGKINSISEEEIKNFYNFQTKFKYIYKEFNGFKQPQQNVETSSVKDNWVRAKIKAKDLLKTTLSPSSSISSLLNNAYDFYAKYVLCLFKKSNFINSNSDNDSKIIGDILHDSIYKYLIDYEKNKNESEDNRKQLFKNIVMEQLEKTDFSNDIVKKIYKLEIDEISNKFILLDDESRKCNIEYDIHPEIEISTKDNSDSGKTNNTIWNGDENIILNFNLKAKCDRVEENNKKIRIIDYKYVNDISEDYFNKMKKISLDTLNKDPKDMQLQLIIEAIIYLKKGYTIDSVESVEYWSINNKDKNDIGKLVLNKDDNLETWKVIDGEIKKSITPKKPAKDTSKEITIKNLVKNCCEILKLINKNYYNLKDDEDIYFDYNIKEKYSDYKQLSRVEELVYKKN